MDRQNIYLSIVEPIYQKMESKDYTKIANLCHKLQEAVDEINERP